MKTTVIAVAVLAAMSMTMAVAGPHRYSTSRGFTDTARVTDVEPIYRTVSTSRPVRECTEEEIYEPVRHDDGWDRDHGDSALGMIVGGVLGGALGHNIGRHHGSNATIAGAVIGSAIGHDVAKRNSVRRAGAYRDYRPRYEQRCYTVNEHSSEQRLDGYRVTYRYHGQSFTTHMDHDPGSHIQVRVRVTPVR